MVARHPDIEEPSAGMPSGLQNPARSLALCLYQGDRDALYRIHGTKMAKKESAEYLF
jgi:lipoprotein-anchoring transpeptidase ErfK/SrfK